MRQIIGIDPGLTGGLALLDPFFGEFLAVGDMPVRQRGNKTEVDGYKLSEYLQPVVKDVKLCILEDVHSMPKQGVVSTFNFGQSFGIVIGVVSAFKIPIVFVRPAVWKSALNLTRDKKDSLKKICQLYPSSKQYFQRRKDDGRAEAALLAHFGLRF